MEPRIQYARTSDGVSIAYAEAGEGRPLISMPTPGFSHVELGWSMFPSIPALASRFHEVTYDARGTGLSDRHAIDFSMEAMLRDLEAVVARTGFDSFVLLGFTGTVPATVTYAVAHPERVSHLILCDGWTSFSDFAQSSAYKASVGLLETDWMLYTETFAQIVWAPANPEFGRQFGAFMRACAEPEAARAFWKAAESYDVTALLPQVTAHTLVVHNRNNRVVPVALGQSTAAAIPGARLTLIDDVTLASIPEPIAAFVSENEPSSVPAPTIPSGTAIILFADIVDSTALTERLGDAAFRAKARELGPTLRTLLRECGGTPVEGPTLGDGVLAVFTSAREAIEAAQRCARAGDEGGLPLHLGLHAGDVSREKDPDGRDNVYGGAVNIASRISGLSAPGEVLVSETVRSLARTSSGVTFEDRGEQPLKGVSEPVRVWAVREGEV